MIKKSWCKIAISFSYIFNVFSDVPLDFHESIRAVPLKYLKYLKYFLPGTNFLLLTD